MSKQNKKQKKLRICEAPMRTIPSFENMFAPAKTFVSNDKMFIKAQKNKLAMDSNIYQGLEGISCNNSFSHTVTSFIGYPFCSELSQYGLIRAGVGILADETTRTWPEFQSAGGEDGVEAAKLLNDEMERLNVRALFHEMATMCGYFGGGLLFIDTGRSVKDLEKPLSITSNFIGKGKVKALVPVEPISVGPLEYNSTNPLATDFYKVDKWFVSGVGPVHHSHFLHFHKNLPPILYRPAYNFFGIPDVQIALDYFKQFGESRDSSARLLKKFSLTVLKTNTDALLYGDDNSDITKRIANLAYNRDNDGIYAISNEEEEIVQINTPLSGVTDIVRQSLELLACVWRYPVVKFLGVSPGGMNATGESDIRSFYDHVETQRQAMFSHNFESIFKIMGLNIFGAETQNINYSWPKLYEMTPKEEAELNKIKADTSAVYVDRAIVSQEEVRSNLASDKKSGYWGMDAEDAPEAPSTYPKPYEETEEAEGL